MVYGSRSMNPNMQSRCYVIKGRREMYVSMTKTGVDASPAGKVLKERHDDTESDNRTRDK